MSDNDFDPVRSLADMRHEFGEHGGVNMSIETSTTFTVMDSETMPEIFTGSRGPDLGGCYLYGRHFNPTVYVLGRQIAALEGAEAGYCTASGMSAIAAAVLHYCDAGDRIVSGATIYGGTFALFREYLPTKTGIYVDFVDSSDLDAVREACTKDTRVLYVESMANPTLRVADVPALAEIAHACGAVLIVDNTFSPLILSPMQHGADVVVHSLTKFMSGASDYIAGAICGRSEFVTGLMDLHMGSLMMLGPTMDPRSAYEISVRLPHLALRMKEHTYRASVFAERLSERGLDVIYPGLADHEDYELLTRLKNDGYGHGGLICVDLQTGDRAGLFMETLQNRDRFGLMAVSLGYFETLMSCSASSTSSEMSDDDLKRAGIRPGLVRLSIGYTGTLEQRWDQLERALSDMGL